MSVTLCQTEGCRRVVGHSGPHTAYPTEVWGFLNQKDKHKIAKAGFATPRGGDKGAYQNHVTRNNKVIVPFEHLRGINLQHFADGWIIRLFPDQYFSLTPEQLAACEPPIEIESNAFVLYRTHDQLAQYPPPPDWQVRHLERNGVSVANRGNGVVDKGHYVLRIAAHGTLPEINQGPPQGIFAPEYCDAENNYLSKCLLAWLITRTIDSPYLTTQAEWLDAVLAVEGLLDFEDMERRGLTRLGMTNCPLCLRQLSYTDLHVTLSFTEEDALGNAAAQVLNATRSTVVNLFHLQPMMYRDVCHTPSNVAWGHATCNTKLGQRRCYSVKELEEIGIKIAKVTDGRIETFAWASESLESKRTTKHRFGRFCPA